MRHDAVVIRRACFLASAVLYAIGLSSVLTLGWPLPVNIGLMLIAFGSGFLVAGIVQSVRGRSAPAS